jgi:hypothetical protein
VEQLGLLVEQGLLVLVETIMNQVLEQQEQEFC